MKAFLKVFLILTGLFLILLTLAALALSTRLDLFGKTALEQSLTFALNAEVAIDSVSFSPLDGKIAARGLAVSNPVGFKRGAALRFENVTVEFDLKTLFSPTPTIRRVLLKDGTIDLRYELNEGSNLARLAEEAARFSKDKLPYLASAQGNAKPSPGKSALRGTRRRFIIQELRCEATAIKLSANLVPATSATVAIAPFTLANLSKEDPFTAGEISAVFLRTVLEETVTVKGLLKPAAAILQRELDKLLGRKPVP